MVVQYLKSSSVAKFSSLSSFPRRLKKDTAPPTHSHDAHALGYHGDEQDINTQTDSKKSVMRQKHKKKVAHLEFFLNQAMPITCIRL